MLSLSLWKLKKSIIKPYFTISDAKIKTLFGKYKLLELKNANQVKMVSVWVIVLLLRLQNEINGLYEQCFATSGLLYHWRGDSRYMRLYIVYFGLYCVDVSLCRWNDIGRNAKIGYTFWNLGTFFTQVDNYTIKAEISDFWKDIKPYSKNKAFCVASWQWKGKDSILRIWDSLGCMFYQDRIKCYSPTLKETDKTKEKLIYF